VRFYYDGGAYTEPYRTSKQGIPGGWQFYRIKALRIQLIYCLFLRRLNMRFMKMIPPKLFRARDLSANRCTCFYLEFGNGICFNNPGNSEATFSSPHGWKRPLSFI
jgi:hypothetical protein